jgi:hypothetical protein
MVSTRRQELEATQCTPPATRSGAGGTPRGPITLPDGRQIKSALKHRLAGVGDNAWNGGNTPLDAGIPKRVRINSGDNTLRIFETEDASESDEGVRALQMHALQLALQRQQLVRQSTRPWLGFMATLAWMIASTLLIFINKSVMVDKGFPFPLALTALGQVASWGTGRALGAAGLVAVKPRPPTGTFFTRLLPVAFCTAATLCLGNYAYLYLSVAFINMLKALTPAVALAVGVAAGVEQPSFGAVVATGIVAWGTSVATSDASADAEFSWIGFAMFGLSIVAEGVRVVLVKGLYHGLGYTPVDVMTRVGLPTVGLLLAGTFAVEWRGLAAGGLTAVVVRPWDIAAVAAASVAVNITTYIAIKETSGVAFKLAGELRWKYYPAIDNAVLTEIWWLQSLAFCVTIPVH